jgi:hypothetical protein
MATFQEDRIIRRIGTLPERERKDVRETLSGLIG